MFASSNILYSIFGTVQILIVLQGVYGTRLGDKFHPGIYQWYLLVFTRLENTKVANTGKYWSIELSHFEIRTEILIKLT